MCHDHAQRVEADGIVERREIARRLVEDDAAGEPAQHLRVAGARQIRDDQHLLRPQPRAELRRHMLADRLRIVLPRGVPIRLRNDEQHHHPAALRVGHADRGGGRHAAVAECCVLDLRRPDAPPGDLQDVVAPPAQLPEGLGVTDGEVAWLQMPGRFLQ
jgi:hypothetical protein